MALSSPQKQALIRWRRDILLFCTEGLRWIPMDHQAEFLLAVQAMEFEPKQRGMRRRKKQLVVKSGQGVGKTTVQVIAMLWRTLRHVDALGVVTANNMRQCKQWINEARRVIKRGDPLLRKMIKFDSTKLTIAKRPMWMITSATARRPEDLQGIHEKHLTIAVDEASGVAADIMQTIKGTLTNPNSMLIAIGNPNAVGTEFHRFFTSQSKNWKTFTFNAEIIAKKYPKIVDPERNRLIADEYGKDSDVYRVRVLGEFPRQSALAVLSPEDVAVCQSNSQSGCAMIDDIMPCYKAMGIDLARGGDDESVIYTRQGLAIVRTEHMRHKDPRDVIDFAFAAQEEFGWDNEDVMYVPDAGGMGQGILHAFYEAGKQVTEFHNEGRPLQAKKFANKESEAWWTLRSMVREHIAYLPRDPRLERQLISRHYYLDRKGRIKVESKKEHLARTKSDESPDRAQALAMAFYPIDGKMSLADLSRGTANVVGSSLTKRR
jgi:phage terminase large subunit